MYYTAYDSWWPSQRFEYSYDRYGHVDRVINSFWDAEKQELIPSTMNITKTDPAGNRLLLERYGWYPDQQAWVGYDKMESTYNEDNRLVLNLYSMWNSDSAAWIFQRRDEISYPGDTVRTTSFVWKTETGEWQYDQKEDSVFDAEKNLTSLELSSWDADSSTWVPQRKMELTYDSNGENTSRIQFLWDPDEKIWKGKIRDEYTYDPAGHVLTHDHYYWYLDSTDWTQDGREIFEYNTSGLLTLHESYKWSAYDQMWRGEFKYTYAYNAKGKPVLYYSYSWDGANDTFTDYERKSYTYDDAGKLLTLFTDRYHSWYNDYSPYERVYYQYSEEKMEVRGICTGDSLLFNDGYYREGIFVIPDTALSGADSTVYLSVTEYPPPPSLTIRGDTSVNVNETYVYTLLPDSAGAYVWEIKNGTIISRPDPHTAEVQWSEAGKGTIKAWIDNNTGCYGDTAAMEVNITLTGVDDLSQDLFYLFPNPAEEQVSVRSPFPVDHIEFYDVSGSVILRIDHPGDGDVIHLEGFPPGLYFYRAMTVDDQLFRGKVIIE